MFEKRIRLFNLLGFEIKLDASWIILALLISWSLAHGYFPYHYPGMIPKNYWLMGIAGALGLFISIILHELSHAIIARKFGIPIKGITLFIFGGVAEMDSEPKDAKSELYMAIAGPIASVMIGFALHGILMYVATPEWQLETLAVIGYLRWINWILAGFNMLPAFPLDGGRVFRSLLWIWKKDLAWATHIASNIGSVFGFMLSVLGAIQFLFGSMISGVWWLLIGMFLHKASQMSYEKLIVSKTFEGEKISQFMQTTVITVEADLTIQDLVENYIYHHHLKFFPVIENNKLIGCISTEQVMKVPREQWPNRHVRDIARSCSGENSISPQTDAIKALSLMAKTKNSRLMVVHQGALIGIISSKDLLNFFTLKIALEGSET
jgi:Zn-dependent protease/predicted transcriptional regulator